MLTRRPRYWPLALMAVAGCGLGEPPPSWSPPVPADRPAAHVMTTTAPAAPSAALDPNEPITLAKALRLALMGNAELAAWSYDVRAAEARRLQAGLLPNPELEFELEEFGGEGSLRRFDAAEGSVQLSQLVELGGKRAGRVRLASLETDLSAWDYEAKRLDVFTATAKAFVATLAAQRRVALAADSLALAGQVSEAVSQRVEVGKAPPLAAAKAGVALSRGRIALVRARHALASARKALAAVCGLSKASFGPAEGNFDRIAALPGLAELAKGLPTSPELARWEAELAHRQAAVTMAKAAAVPDVTVGAGIKRLEETNEHAFIVGLSVPLPVFDRNQGGILEARHNLAKARQEKRAAEIRADSGLHEAYQVLSAARSEAAALADEVLPAAEKAFQAARQGQREGKFAYLDVLDAQRTLFETKAEYIDALAAYHKAVADIERLVGRPVGKGPTTRPAAKEKSNER